MEQGETRSHCGEQCAMPGLCCKFETDTRGYRLGGGGGVWVGECQGSGEVFSFLLVPQWGDRCLRLLFALKKFNLT